MGDIFITEKDFIKAKAALEKANVPGPYHVLVNPSEWTETQWMLYDRLCDENDPNSGS
jgi:hypothetical protein